MLDLKYICFIWRILNRPDKPTIKKKLAKVFMKYLFLNSCSVFRVYM